MSNARLLAKLFRLALGLPTDPEKTYGFKPETGWVEASGGVQKRSVVERFRQGLFRTDVRYYDGDEGCGICYRPFFTTAITLSSFIAFPMCGYAGAGAGAGMYASVGDIVQLTPGTTATGEAYTTTPTTNQRWYPIYTGSKSISASDIQSAWAGVNISFSALSTSAQRYTYAVGMLGGPYFASGLGMRFVYSDNINSGKWRIEYANAVNSTVIIDTSVPVTIYNQVLECLMTRDESGVATVEFFIDGVSVGTTAGSTRWSSDATLNDRTFPEVGHRIVKSVGTTAVYCNILGHAAAIDFA